MIDTLLIFSRLLLTVIFFVAGVTKLKDQVGFRKSIIDFGLPKNLASPLSLIIPVLEIIVALLLISATTSWFGAIIALFLLLAFTIGILINLKNGKAPECHCFGQLNSAPIGRLTILRNVLFILISGFLVWRGTGQTGPSLIEWASKLSFDLDFKSLVIIIFSFILIALISIEGWMIFQIVRQQGRMLLRIESLEQERAIDYPTNHHVMGLSKGLVAPSFNLVNLDGVMMSLDSLRSDDKPIMLIFSDPNCGPCSTLAPEINRWQKEFKDILKITVISRGTVEENLSKFADPIRETILLQENDEVFQNYKVNGTPMAVIISTDGAITSHTAAGMDEITKLIQQAKG